MADVADSRVASQSVDDAIDMQVLTREVQLLINNIGVTVGTFESKGSDV